MDYTDATDYLQWECDNMTGQNQNDLQDCINKFETGTQAEKQGALETVNDLYWDANWSNQNNAGQAIFCVAYSVDPTKVYPKIKV